MSWFALREYSSGHIAYVCKITHTSLRAACDVIFNGAIHYDTNVLLRETRGIRYVISYRISNRNHTHRKRLSATDTFFHDDVIKWKHFPRYWPFVRGIYPRGIYRSPVNCPTQRPVVRSFGVFFDLRPNQRLSKQWCARIKGWVNNGEAGDLRRHRAYYDVIVMLQALRFHISWDVSFFQFKMTICHDSFIALTTQTISLCYISVYV